MWICRYLAGFALFNLAAFGQVVASSVAVAAGPSEIHGSTRFPVPRYRGSPILGAPYSAKRVSEQVMVGSDGTRFTNSYDQETIYRDSQGRTRTERQTAMSRQNFESPLIVEISDPVAGFDYILDTQHKVAHRVQHATIPPGKFAAGNGQLIPAGPAAVAAAPAAGASGSFAVGGGVGTAASAQVRAPAQTAGGAAPAAAVTPAGQAPPRPQIQHEDLGEQMIEGVMARGTRTTESYPTGAVGNDRPFTSVRENWYSRELGEGVLFKSSDPRRGENTIKLIHIDRSEPPISIFQPPADYNLVDETAPFEIQWTGTVRQ